MMAPMSPEKNAPEAHHTLPNLVGENSAFLLSGGALW